MIKALSVISNLSLLRRGKINFQVNWITNPKISKQKNKKIYLANEKKNIEMITYHMVGIGFPQLYNNLLTKAFNDYDYVLLQWINTQKRQVYS